MTFQLPNEIWCKIIRHSKISTLFELRRVDTKFYDLVEQDATYQSYIEEEEKILHALVENWLGSPFDDIRPLEGSDWELITPILRARFRCLAKKRGFEEIMERAAEGSTTHYMSNKGWLYKMFVRKLHDNQRRKIIEPLRHRFDAKLRMKDYICNNCGDPFKPAEARPCRAHQFDQVKQHPKCNNVWYFKCCPERLFFARNGQPLAEVRRALGHCPANPGDKMHFSGEFGKLNSPKYKLDSGIACSGNYDVQKALYGAAEKDGFRVPHFPASRPLSHFHRPSCAVTYGFGYSAPYPACATFGFPFQLGGSYLPYQPQAPQNAIYTNSVNANSNAFPNSTLAQEFSTIKIQPPFQNRNQSRLPNPKKEFRFDSADWDDFFDNDFDYHHVVDSDDDFPKKRKNQKNAKKTAKSGQLHKNGFGGGGAKKSSEKMLQSARSARMVPNTNQKPAVQSEPSDNLLSSYRFNNPPGEFEIGVWKPE